MTDVDAVLEEARARLADTDEDEPLDPRIVDALEMISAAIKRAGMERKSAIAAPLEVKTFAC